MSAEASESDGATVVPAVEEAAQEAKHLPQEEPRISTESTESLTSTAIDGVARLSISSEGSKDNEAHVNGMANTDPPPSIAPSQPNGTDTTSLQSRISSLEQANAKLNLEKQKSDAAYTSLLSKVQEIRKNLTSRFQQNEKELAANAETINQLETENQALTETVTTLQTEISSLSTENATLSDQVSSLRREVSGAQSRETDWDRDRNRLEKAKRQLESEVDNMRLALSNWERTANEEHSIAESSRDRIVLLEEEIASYRDHQDNVRGEAERYREEADKLRRALRDVQEERKRELREVVEGMEGQIERLNARVEQAEKRAAEAEMRLEENQKELNRLKPFEAEVKEKSALLGKTRHEAVILNEHLTKALRLLKRASPASTVDKMVMTNFLLQFLSLPREDTKRFEILNLISSLLEWNDEQRQKAGLARSSGAKDSSFRRTNSNPMLSDYPMSPGLDRKESMSELWINFLQKEAAAKDMGSPVDTPTSPPFTRSAGGSTPGTPTPTGKR